ncbi:Pro-interleukin-16 [Trachymyrmex septentrionalis]|uniref:Pro-interleukin-16 n=1 Tax=Trachymyrmex septentrionalis TaxID=34720 RepID=A0A151JYK1_9HYME|nr:Pro-interleukin-16 [Trachymyrmex septentrionalis]
MVYLDARSQCGSTHGSTSDDTGSSMSTVVDRFSTSDRVSTISTTSTASTAGSEQPSEFSGVDRDLERSSDRDVLLSRAICPLEHLERDFSNPPDYLLRRLANSEAVTHVESRGEVERITAVVAPNTVLIEETITLQPPLSFQDAPLSYGHEARPDLFYTADLAADSTTHFRPIKDDVELVERVNGNHEEFQEAISVSGTGRSNGDRSSPPPLPARNHVNRICVNQMQTSESGNEARPPRISVATVSVSSERELSEEAPLLPPKPLPRKDVKARRKRPPPPPPPPIITPRREIKPSIESNRIKTGKENNNLSQVKNTEDVRPGVCSSSPNKNNILDEKSERIESSDENFDKEPDMENICLNNEKDKAASSEENARTNKVFEIIEIRMAKGLQSDKKEEDKSNNTTETANCEQNKVKNEAIDRNEQDQLQPTNNSNKVSPERENSILESTDELIDESNDEKENCINSKSYHQEETRTNNRDNSKKVFPTNKEGILSIDNSTMRDNENEEIAYQSLDVVNDDIKNPEINQMLENEEITEEEDTTDESDDGDYYWQSNLATIGEEEETSLEYMNANADTNDSSELTVEPEESPSAIEKDVFVKNDTVNGKMENCGGGQRLPPDGDEFPAAYQEFNNSNNQPPYRYIATTRTATITANDAGLCNENESFRTNETVKMLANDSNVVSSRSIILSDSKITFSGTENVRQDINKVASASMESVRSEVGKATSSNVDNIRQDVKSTEITNEEKKSSYHTSEDIAKKNTSIVAGSSLYSCQTTTSNLIMSEKKMEIAGYYHKAVTTLEEVPSHVEKDALIDTPPPLPLTGPPKIEQVLHTRITSTVESPQRKFSLNGDLWRQDDKSERSVRDKIAMFSSQSNLDAPLFPNAITAAAATSNSKRLSKYKSSEDVCCDDKSNGQKDRPSFFADRTQSSFDLTDSAKTMTGHDSAKKYNQRTLSLPQTVQPALLSPTAQTTRAPKTLPIVPPKSLSNPLSTFNSIKPTGTPSLTRATSFSGPAPFVQDRDSLTTDSISNSQISRTNSLASTFRRPGEDVRRNSLNQLIEQRRRSISKLRGLVIPEKDTVSIDQPIVDLPEIKSRDSILLHQIPKANIQDKWGSQSSLASNASTASQPLKATTSFKMPAPQIYSKYSPAFKRKSLTVYGTSVTTNSTINGSSPIKSSQSTAMSTFSEPPKSLESICSPTRSDYSFEFASTTSSPDGSRTRPRIMQRKARLDYDDSDNDSAVSSSQSSISRGFSPPMSPVPSERSTISSERSYVSAELNCQRRPLIADNLSRISVARDIRDQIAASDKDQFTSRIGVLGERTYLAERSSSSSSGSPQPNEFVSRSSQIPQRQLRRSNSTDTNCSTSSTLTSGSQASAESLSRRVLKPQSVEAINRKNILASARCRSGRDLNGSPLIQRKFSDDEDAVKETIHQNGGAIHQMSNNSGSDPASKQEIKIAYIEVADPFAEDEEPLQRKEEKPKLPPKMSFPPPAVRPPKSEMLEPSNDLKMWVRAEVKTLARSMEEKSRYDKSPILAAQNLETRNSRGSIFNQPAITAYSNNDLSSKNRTTVSDMKVTAMEMSKPQSKANSTPRKNMEDQNDLLTILTTKSRSRSAIHVDEGTFGRSKSQMSLEDILGAKPDLKLSRAQNTEPKIEKNGIIPSSPVKSAWEISKENRYGRRGSITSNESLSEDRSFVSKIPTLGRTKTVDSGDEMTESVERIKSVTASKIPTSRGLNRRSASVTDMKKALEKVDTSPMHSQSQQNASNTHNRFPSLDSSVDENIGTEMDTDRCYGEQFGSISSLASSTSLISQQELAQLVEEASLEEARGAHDVIVVLLHKENPTGSVGITLAGGADCEVKEITVHRVLTHSIADKDGRVQRGDRILSINGRSTRGLTHRESMAVLKQPRSEVVLVVSRVRMEEGCKLRSRTASVETIVEGLETNGNVEDIAWGPPSTVAVYKDGAGLGFSLEGGRDSPLGDRPLIIKKIFTGGAAEKTGALKAGDQLLEVNGNDVTRMSRIEAWSLMKKLHDGEVNLLVRHPATKSS